MMYYEIILYHYTMFSKIWPGFYTLYHRLKAIYAPHPVFINCQQPTSYLTTIFNSGWNSAVGGARLSIFSNERQHNFCGIIWYYNIGFTPNLWRRWLRYKINNNRGKEEEMAGEGRMCFPIILLYPVKKIDLMFKYKEQYKCKVL